MFQFVAVFILLATGQMQAQIKTEPSFNTLEECADSLPDEYLKVTEILKDQPVGVTLGCLKTGEKS